MIKFADFAALSLMPGYIICKLDFRLFKLGSTINLVRVILEKKKNKKEH
jgi:hypothetical protein